MDMLSIPTRYACPQCVSMAQSYGEHAERHAKYELEDRLRDGTASLPERIKAAWSLYGNNVDWDRGGPVVRIPTDRRFASVSLDFEERMEPQKYITFEFQRDVTNFFDPTGTKALVTTRVHCMGVTVSETYS